MFYLYGAQGRLFGGALEQLRLQPRHAVRPAEAVAAARRSGHATEHGHVEPDSLSGGISSQARQALSSYARTGSPSLSDPRFVLRQVAEVMQQPARCLSDDMTVDAARQLLAREGIGQAPVVAQDGTLVGLAGRADLLPIDRLAALADDPEAWRALLARPVSAVMWTPVPATRADTDLRRVAELLLGSGLPGLPVVRDDGRVHGFVSRSDLLRAMVVGPPLDLWG